MGLPYTEGLDPPTYAQPAFFTRTGTELRGTFKEAKRDAPQMVYEDIMAGFSNLWNSTMVSCNTFGCITPSIARGSLSVVDTSTNGNGGLCVVVNSAFDDPGTASYDTLFQDVGFTIHWPENPFVRLFNPFHSVNGHAKCTNCHTHVSELTIQDTGRVTVDRRLHPLYNDADVGGMIHGNPLNT
jgi:hypothetical protein